MFFKQLKEELFSSPLYLFSVLFLLLLVASASGLALPVP